RPNIPRPQPIQEAICSCVNFSLNGQPTVLTLLYSATRLVSVRLILFAALFLSDAHLQVCNRLRPTHRFFLHFWAASVRESEAGKPSWLHSSAKSVRKGEAGNPSLFHRLTTG